jgi:hypothetical protein
MLAWTFSRWAIQRQVGFRNKTSVIFDEKKKDMGSFG